MFARSWDVSYQGQGWGKRGNGARLSEGSSACFIFLLCISLWKDSVLMLRGKTEQKAQRGTGSAYLHYPPHLWASSTLLNKSIHEVTEQPGSHFCQFVCEKARPGANVVHGCRLSALVMSQEVGQGLPVAYGRGPMKKRHQRGCQNASRYLTGKHGLTSDFLWEHDKGTASSEVADEKGRLGLAG